ncbi:MAG: trypsin-like serine protease [Bdellovibrionota bacterium]|nr:trypsin-like serine protease [Bdellovibrionota bacterium]
MKAKIASLFFVLFFNSVFAQFSVFDSVKSIQINIQQGKPKLALDQIVELEESLDSFGMAHEYSDVLLSLKAMALFKQGSIHLAIEKAQQALAEMKKKPSNDPIVEEFRPQLQSILSKANRLSRADIQRLHMNKLTNLLNEVGPFSVKSKNGETFMVHLEPIDNWITNCSLSLYEKREHKGSLKKRNRYIVDFRRLKTFKGYYSSSYMKVHGIKKYFLRLGFGRQKSNDNDSGYMIPYHYFYYGNSTSHSDLRYSDTIDIDYAFIDENAANAATQIQKREAIFTAFSDLRNVCHDDKLLTNENQIAEPQYNSDKVLNSQIENRNIFGVVSSVFINSEGKKKERRCGGTVLFKDYVLTAASCIQSPSGNKAIGVYFRSLVGERFGLVGRIANSARRGLEAYLLKNYVNSKDIDYHDMAILKIRKPWEKATTIIPINMASPFAEKVAFDSEKQIHKSVVHSNKSIMNYGSEQSFYEIGCTLSKDIQSHNCMSIGGINGASYVTHLESNKGTTNENKLYVMGTFSYIPNNSFSKDVFIPLTKERIRAIHNIKNGLEQSEFVRVPLD